MKQGIFEILSNRELAEGRFELMLSGDSSGIIPGQFCEISVEGFFLRRPFSVCNAENGVLTVVYHVLGGGTETLSRLRSGSLDVLTCLGNGYCMDKAGDRPLLIGGGTGLTPVNFLARELIKKGVKPRVIMGFASERDVFYYDELCALGCDTVLMTVDGSAGIKGVVTDVMTDTPYTRIYSCGPIPMLQAIAKAAETECEFSLEARMGCGFGACMGCTVETVNSNKRVCKDGPVFTAKELGW